jgi:hypothetical protein
MERSRHHWWRSCASQALAQVPTIILCEARGLWLFDGGISLQLRLAGGGRGIRTLGPGLSGVRADVCVSCAESTGSEILRQTPSSPFDTLNRLVSRNFLRRSVGACVAESGLCQRLQSGETGSHMTACLPGSPTRKIPLQGVLTRS